MTPEEIKAAVTAKYNSAVETFNRAQPGVFGQAQPVFIDDAQPAGPMPESQEDLRPLLLTELDAMSGIHAQSVKDRGNGTWGESVEFASATTPENPDIAFQAQSLASPSDFNFSQGSTVEPATADFQTDSPSPANSADGFELTVAPVLPQNFQADAQFDDTLSPNVPEVQFSEIAASLPQAESLPFPSSKQATAPSVPPLSRPAKPEPKESPHVRRSKQYLQRFHEQRKQVQSQAVQQPVVAPQSVPPQPEPEVQTHYVGAAPGFAPDVKAPAQPQPSVVEPQRKSPGPGVRPAWETGRLRSAPVEHPAIPQQAIEQGGLQSQPAVSPRQGYDHQIQSTVTWAEEQAKAAEMIGSLFDRVTDALLVMQSRLEQVERIIDKSLGGYIP